MSGRPMNKHSASFYLLYCKHENKMQHIKILKVGVFTVCDLQNNVNWH